MSQMRQATPAASSTESGTVKAVPLSHPTRNGFAALIVVLILVFAFYTSQNQNYRWAVVAQYLFSPQMLKGVVATIQLTVSAMLAGIGIGILLAFMRVSENPIFSTISRGYTWFFRGIPLLVQVIFWYNISALYPNIGIDIFGLRVSLDMNSLISPWVAGLLALSLHEGAYMAEIVRGGFLAVDPGQSEAAKSLGFTRAMTIRRVVLPQAARWIIPPTGNQFISMLKTTSLVSVLAVPEILYSAQIIYSRNFQTIPLLLVATIWYLMLTTVFSVGQYFLERYYRKLGG